MKAGMDFYPSQRESAVPGLLIGKVVANYDDKHKGMVQVAYYSHDGKGNTTDWVRVASPSAGKDRGMFFLPETGDEVLVAFINNDINNPCVIGSLWNDENGFPKDAVTKENTVKTIMTRTGAKICIRDEKGKETVTVSTPNGIEITLADEHDSVTIKDSKGKNQIKLSGKDGDITICAENKLTLKSKEIDINADKVQISASNSLAAKGAKIEVKANSEAELSASGTAKVTGSMVKITANGMAELKGALVKING